MAIAKFTCIDVKAQAEAEMSQKNGPILR